MSLKEEAGHAVNVERVKNGYPTVPPEALALALDGHEDGGSFFYARDGWIVTYSPESGLSVRPPEQINPEFPLCPITGGGTDAVVNISGTSSAVTVKL